MLEINNIIIFITLIISTLVLGFTSMPWIISYPIMVEEEIKKTSVIVVLYCGYGEIKQNGLGKYSLNRVHKSLELWKKNQSSYLLFSGGNSDNKIFNLTGSERMALEALRFGVPREKLIVENKSKDTRYNVLNSSLIIRKKGWKELILVTDNYHIKRALDLFQSNGLKVYPAPVIWREKGDWKSNWTYLKFLSYELQARAAYLLLNKNQIDLLINYMRP